MQAQEEASNLARAMEMQLQEMARQRHYDAARSSQEIEAATVDHMQVPHAPVSLASLAWMSAATEQQQAQIGPPPRILTASTADPLVSEPPPVTPPKHATVQFGTAIAPKRGSPRPPASTPHGTASGDEMAQQLSLF